MVKRKTKFVCQHCGYETAKWMGKCPGCHSWNAMVEETEIVKPHNRALFVHTEGIVAKPVSITTVETTQEPRIDTKFTEFNRVLGGGIVRGSLVLIGGDPGIGKSTLLLQICAQLANDAHTVLYISGEESVKQTKLRAERLHVTAEHLYVLSETNLEHIIQTIDEMKPAFVVIDSIQTIYRSEITSAPGSVSQVRECTAELMRIAKTKGIAIFIVGHVTKEGALAGPRILEHMVDTVLYFEGERHHTYRILRAVSNQMLLNN